MILSCTFIYGYQCFCFSICCGFVVLVWFVFFIFTFFPSSSFMSFFLVCQWGRQYGKGKGFSFLWKKKKKSAWDSIYHKYVAIFLLKMDIFQLLCLSKQAIKNHAIWSTNPNTLVVRYFPTPLRVTVHTNKYISLTEAAGEISDVFSCLWLLPNPHTNSCSRLKSS